jgi:hypothetical protein
VGIPAGGCSSPAKRPTKASAPGVGRERRIRRRRRQNHRTHAGCGGRAVAQAGVSQKKKRGESPPAPGLLLARLLHEFLLQIVFYFFLYLLFIFKILEFLEKIILFQSPIFITVLTFGYKSMFSKSNTNK